MSRSSTFLTVSVMATAGTAAPCAFAAAMARDEGAAQKRSRGIVDQHEIGRGMPQCLKSGADRSLARGAARNRRQQTL